MLFCASILLTFFQHNCFSYLSHTVHKNQFQFHRLTLAALSTLSLSLPMHLLHMAAPNERTNERKERANKSNNNKRNADDMSLSADQRAPHLKCWRQRQCAD